jgi:lipid-binding SYLF domain-containing protein
MAMQTILCVVLLLVATALPAEAKLKKSQIDRLDNAAQIMADTGAGIGIRAKCLAVIPAAKRLAFGFGAEYGKGVLTCRNGDLWSSPVFIQLGRVSFGPQIGGQQSDLVLLIKNEQGVRRLLDDKLTLGVDGTVAAGPIGRHAEAATDAQMTAEILAYSHSQGLFAGVAIVGGVLKPDPDANEDLYGREIQPREILLGSTDEARTTVTQRLPAPVATFVRAVSRAQGQPSLAERDAEKARDVAHAVSSRLSDTDSQEGSSKQSTREHNVAAERDTDQEQTSKPSQQPATEHSVSPGQRNSDSERATKQQAPDANNVKALLDRIEQTVNQLEREESNPGATVGTSGTTGDSTDSGHQEQLRKLRRQIESLRDALADQQR